MIYRVQILTQEYSEHKEWMEMAKLDQEYKEIILIGEYLGKTSSYMGILK